MDRRQQEELIISLIRSLGASLKNRALYPPTHPLVRSPLEKCYSELRLFFADKPELALAISDDTLVFEGVPIFSLTSSLESFVARLGKIGIRAVIFGKELAQADIEGFIRFLHESRDEGLAAAAIQEKLEALGVRNIRVTPPEEGEDSDLELAREIYDSAVAAVATVLSDLRAGRIPSGAESERVVREMGSMLKRNRDAMLALTLIKNFDEYTYNHSVNVSVISLTLADAMSLTDSERVEVGVAGLLHDVGKTQLAIDLIRKPGPLTIAEFEEIKKHPEEGFVLLGKMSHIRPGSAYIVREHHMRFDRTGYPRPEQDYAVNPYAHVIAVADCYDALTTMRSYQKARTPLQAIEIMGKLGGKSLSPEIVAVLEKSLGAFPVGTMVRLDSMEVGVVTGTKMPGEEVRVTVLYSRDGTPVPHHERVEIAPSGAGRTILGTVNPLLYPHGPESAFLKAT